MAVDCLCKCHFKKVRYLNTEYYELRLELYTNCLSLIYFAQFAYYAPNQFLKCFQKYPGICAIKRHIQKS